MKIQLFILGLCVVTFAQDDINSISERNGLTHNREWHERHEVPMPERNDNDRNNGERQRNGFTHNREWHERHGVPMPQGNDINAGDGCHHFTHSREWHERHEIPMPANPQPYATTTTRPITRTVTRATARPTTSPPETSREIYDPTRQDDEYDETWIRMP